MAVSGREPEWFAGYAGSVVRPEGRRKRRHPLTEHFYIMFRFSLSYTMTLEQPRHWAPLAEGRVTSVSRCKQG